MNIQNIYYDFFYQKWFISSKRNEDQQKVIFNTDYKNDIVTDINIPQYNRLNYATFNLDTFTNDDKKEYLEFLL